MSALESANEAGPSPRGENDADSRGSSDVQDAQYPDAPATQDSPAPVDIGPSQGFWGLGSDDQTATDSKARNRRLRDRPSAMEVLQSVSQAPQTIPKETVKKEDQKEIVKDEPGPDATTETSALEFRVASPSLAKMINEYGSDCSSPVGSVKLEGLDTDHLPNEAENAGNSAGDAAMGADFDSTEQAQSPQSERAKSGSAASVTRPMDSEDSSMPSLPDLVQTTLSFPSVPRSQPESLIDSRLITAPDASPYRNKMRKRRRQSKPWTTKSKPWTTVKRRSKKQADKKQVETETSNNDNEVENENEEVERDTQASEELSSLEPTSETQTESSVSQRNPENSSAEKPDGIGTPGQECDVPGTTGTQIIHVLPLKKKRSPGRPPGRKSPGRPPGRNSPKGLKLRIKLGDTKRRGHKRRYTEDQEYTPTATTHKKVRVESDLPKRSSARRNENDIYLDRYRYLLSFSDESRTPSPAISEESAVPPPVDCKPCRVELFDFVKCLNIKDLACLDDLAYNKNIRRQIRALEKGHRIEMEKKLATTSSVAQASSEVEPLPALVAKEATVPDPDARDDGSFSDHIDDVLDEVVPNPEKPPREKKKKKKHNFGDHIDEVLDEVVHPGEKKKKKKRKKSGQDDAQIPAPIESTSANEPQQPEKEAEASQELLLGRKHFRCRQCTFVTADLPCIQEHINLHEEPFHCSECTATFPQISRALEHTINAHPNTPARVDRVSDFNPNDHFDEIHAVSPPRVNEEKDTHYQCQLCTYKTDDRSEIESHLLSNHKAEYKYICKICDLAFCRKRDTMLRHFRKWHPDQPLDFTTAPGVEDPVVGEKPADNTDKDPMEKERPTSVISIASDGGAVEKTVESDDIQIIGADTTDPTPPIQVIGADTTDPTPPSPPPATPAPAVLGPEARPCSYKCLECGAKTDTFDVICAHLEVSHPSTDYNFACPFCSDYKAKTCSFVAEHIRTMHSEHSNRCMERLLENATAYVTREYVGPPRLVAGTSARGQSVPPRTDSARSSNQENKSPDDEVMILDVANQSSRREPFQPLSLVHHSAEQTAPAQPQMVQIFPDFSITKSEYDRYQVFNLKPPTGPPARPIIRPTPPALTQPSQSRPAQPRPMPTLQPRPFISTNYYAPVQNASIGAIAPSNPTFPHLLSLMNPGLPSSMAQPVLYNGVHNPSR